MKKLLIALALALILALAFILAPNRPAVTGDLKVQPFPADLDLSSVEGLYKSAAYKVEVRRSGEDAYMPSFVFETRNEWVLLDFFNADKTKHSDVLRTASQIGGGKSDQRTASFSQFSFADTAVDVRITLLKPGAEAQSVTIRPLRHDIPAKISADSKTITFTLAKPLKISVEINDRLDPLFLFADAPDIPDPEATHYFGPGIHRIPGDGTLTVKTDERVYLAAGAIVEGRFFIPHGSTRVSIRGRGIVNTGEWPMTSTDVGFLGKHSSVRSTGTSHTLIEGITFANGSGWTIAIDDWQHNKTHDNQYRNLKMVHWAGCTDGVWITGDNNIADDLFIFHNDDAIVSKGGKGSRASNIVVWGGVWGRTVLLFGIGGSSSVSDLLVENVDVIGKEGGTNCFHVRGANPAIRFDRITFRDFRFEERRVPSSYNANRFLDAMHTELGGRISDWKFENISFDRKLPDEGSILATLGKPYENITFQNLRMGGELILSAGAANLRTNPAVTGLKFLPPAP